MLNIVVPMAGEGSRFARAGFQLPKPLIPVLGFPMIRVVIANLTPSVPHRFIFICRENHLQTHSLAEKLSRWAPGCVVRTVETLTDGAACTVLTVRDLIDSGDSLMVANCDQWLDTSIDAYLVQQARRGLDGQLMTMQANDPKWSFIGLNAHGLIERVVEKQVISDEATVGVYNWRHGADFVRDARAMVAANDRVNGEFYVAPVYNYGIRRGQKYGYYRIGAEGNGMHGIGIPSDLEAFVAGAASVKATRSLQSESA